MPVQTPDELHTVFLGAFNAGNLDAVMEFYEETAALVPQPGLITAGHQANRQALLQFLALKGTMQMRTAFSPQVRRCRAPSWRVDLERNRADGKPVEMSGKNVEGARHQSDGTWRCAIDHPLGAS